MCVTGSSATITPLVHLNLVPDEEAMMNLAIALSLQEVPHMLVDEPA